MPIGRQDYEERKEQKIEIFEEKARKSNATANQEITRAKAMGSVIPFGQPILVGHHSERSHRSLLKKIDTAHRKVSEAIDKADYYENRAEAAANNRAISGDDPQAVKRYQEKLAKLEERQEYMKAVNKAWKQGKAALMEFGLSEAESEKLANEKTKPCPSWMLGNNNAEINRVRKRLVALNNLDNMEAGNIKFNGGEMLINVELNRVQFIFDDIPAPEIRATLKSHGFKWARTLGAWQRQRTANAINAAKRLIDEIKQP
jgi:hypothetical protein